MMEGIHTYNYYSLVTYMTSMLPYVTFYTAMQCDPVMMSSIKAQRKKVKLGKRKTYLFD